VYNRVIEDEFRYVIFPGEVSFMDINETIKSQLADNPVILFMKGSPQAPQCGFSAKTVQALMACGERFAFVNILDNQELREGLKAYSSWPTYPQLYVNSELVGGCDIIMEMSENGELAELVKAAANKAEA
jgi:monothiol glutaredoxin